MSTVIISPNMGMPVPIPGSTPGTEYATDLVNSLGRVDIHNHTPGYGAPIPSAGLLINASLPMYNNLLTLVQGINFVSQSSNAAVNTLFMKGSDLWFTPPSGSSFAITNGGMPVSSTSSIVNGNATAFFSAGVLVVESNTTTSPPTAANIDGASLVMRNTSPNSTFGLTLSAPAALASNFTITLPVIPSAANAVMIMDTSGTVTTQTPNALAAVMTSTGTNAILQTSTSTATINSKIPTVSVAAPSSSRLGIVRGNMNSSGGIISGEGFTVNHSATGTYLITFSTAFTDAPAITTGSLAPIVLVSNISTTGFRIDLQVLSGPTPSDQPFAFIAIGITS